MIETPEINKDNYEAVKPLGLDNPCSGCAFRFTGFDCYQVVVKMGICCYNEGVIFKLKEKE